MSWNILSQTFLWVIVICQFFVIFYLTRILSQFLTRFRTTGQKVEEMSLQVGTSAPLFRAKDSRGNTVKIHDYIGRDVLLLFSNPSCSTCESLLEKASSLEVPTFIISPERYSDERIKRYPQFIFLYDPNLLENYYIQKVPTLVVVDQYGNVATIGGANQFEEIQDSIRTRVDKQVQIG
ncbi:hypothetical protein IHV09_09375 [Fictibacillus sp. 23RED33]|uniref:peroxiredoxin family protein n=1 Tax=Fictibacillus sp. 23RED33 TaxID=2745879 RepID=UPI0018CE8DC2|nr:hypothetical protein [Fictibacillus sp. 23RED33]MBH0173769.1 hypothetical protein [Fictibacillus sp. 23RED33]